MIEFLLNYSDWIGYILIAIALYELNKKDFRGWLLASLGTVWLIIFGIHFKKYGIVFGNLIFLWIYFSSYLQASKIISNMRKK